MVADAVARSAATAPHVTLTLPVDMSEATRFRQQVLPAIEKRTASASHSRTSSPKPPRAPCRTIPYLNSTLAGR